MTNGVSIELPVVMIAVGHGGSRTFAVELLDSQEKTVEVLVDTTGPYGGVRALNLTPGEYVLDIDADGQWVIEIGQFHPLRTGSPPPIEGSGQGANVLGPVETDRELRAIFHGTDQSTYDVWMLDNHARKQSLLFDAAGPTEERSTVFQPPSVSLISIETAAKWSLRIESA